MNGDRFFLDTVYVVALLNEDDQFHISAKTIFSFVREAQEIWLHEGILLEIANHLRFTKRQEACGFIHECYNEPNTHVVPLNNDLFIEAVEFYRIHLDKEWSLTDCISFIVMKQNGLSEALTADNHFEQAGFKAVLLSTSE
ncbi:MAG: type II toxin-antitoxin system VapC family toxin [Deltaproteobacteria bacterium]|nr:type II toxin-antitoxin system VapC family toxin [Deltaproteobacteria bacterium]